MAKTIIIGTRGSELALWQANFLLTQLTKQGFKAELKVIKTQGDKIQHLSLEKLEGKGFFTKEIEDALLRKEIDVAVHSHKDLPTENTAGLIIAAISEREDCSELLLIRKESADTAKEFHLKENAIVGTSSARRKVQLHFYRPDLICHDIRGNVPSRINKLRKGNYDAVLLAYAGVHRLNLDVSDLHIVKIEPEKFIPAPAQGVLAFQCRNEDGYMKEILQKVDHPAVREAIAVERKVLQLFQGGCHMPLGVYCKKEKNDFHVFAAQAKDTESPLRRLYCCTHENTVAYTVYMKLQKQIKLSVFITRDISMESNYYRLLQAASCSVSGKSFVEMHEIKIDEVPACDWLFFTSANGVKYFFNQIHQKLKFKIGVVGQETAAAVRSFGYNASFTGNGDMAVAMEKFTELADKNVVCLPQALHPRQNPDKLYSGIKWIKLPVYENKMKQSEKAEACDIIVFTSPLNADGYLQANSISDQQTVIAIGKTTKKHLNEKGYEKVLIPHLTSLTGAADLICGL